MEPHLEVENIVANVAHFVDHRRWADLRALFAGTVTVDYTSLHGGEVDTESGDALIEGWREALEPLDATQHLLGQPAVELDTDDATVVCHVQAIHRFEKAPGGPEWTVAGTYEFELHDFPAGWQIVSLRLNTLYQSGNEMLLEEAAIEEGPEGV